MSPSGNALVASDINCNQCISSVRNYTLAKRRNAPQAILRTVENGLNANFGTEDEYSCFSLLLDRHEADIVDGINAVNSQIMTHVI